MPKVYDRDSIVVAEIEGDLLRDFFDEILIEGKTLKETLNDYKPEVAEQLSNYIVARLAEVEPGYLPYHGL